MKAIERGRLVIGEALARAMYDLPRFMVHTLRQGFTHSVAMEIARRMTRELDHAGWRVKSGERREVLSLQDQIAFGLSVTDCVKLVSDDPGISKPARDRATSCICSSLSMAKVVLVKKVH